MEDKREKSVSLPTALGDALRRGLKPVIPAPMAGYTDAIYRGILREHGTAYLTYPLLSAHAALANKPETRKILSDIEAEGDLIVQLFGGFPETIEQAAKVVADMGAVGIDFNLGCSVKKIARSGGGAILLNDIPRARECLEALGKAVDIPLSVKTRIGYGFSDRTSSLEILNIVQELGYSHATIHGRTFKQGFADKADWEFIAEYKAAASIPIIGNGDVTDYWSCRDMFDRTGVDGVMIGRAIIGNPFVVTDCREYIQNDVIPPPRIGRTLLNAGLYHYRRVIEKHGPDRGNKEMRKFLGKYIHGIRGATALRIRINSTDIAEEVIHILEEAVSLQPAVGSS